MGDLIVSLAGTPAGGRLAIALALFSALAHATFGAINKGGGDAFINRGAINIVMGLIAAPFALFLLPWPTPELFWLLAGAFLIHPPYEWLLCACLQRGAFTLVYPVARGTGPLATALLSMAVFGEWLEAGQWAGLLLLTAAIFGLAAVNLRRAPVQDVHALRTALGLALATGGMVAIYTTYDAYGVRAAANPFTYLAWFFFLSMFGFPLYAALRWRRLAVKPRLKQVLWRGVAGAVVGMGGFGAIMIATRLDKVGEAAALRETSIIFASILGVVFFRERLTAPKAVLIGLIALGAILVEFG